VFRLELFRAGEIERRLAVPDLAGAEYGSSCIRRSLVLRNLLILLALSAVEIVRPALRV
jgi:hypothetical protein